MPNNLKLDVDAGFEKAGEFGPYQLLIIVLVGLTSCIPAIFIYGGEVESL